MRRSARRLVSGLLLGLLATAWPATGEEVPPTRVISLRWKHPGGVAGFKVYARPLSQESYGKGVDVGLPESADGVFAHDVTVSNLEASFVVITAYDEQGVESAHSNEQLFLLD